MSLLRMRRRLGQSESQGSSFSKGECTVLRGGFFGDMMKLLQRGMERFRMKTGVNGGALHVCVCAFEFYRRGLLCRGSWDGMSSRRRGWLCGD